VGSRETTSLAADAVDARGRRYLLVFEAGRTRLVDLPEHGVLVLGRDLEAEIVLDDSSVSRRHAEITCDGPIVTIRDLGSRNGTRLAATDERLTGPTPLAPGHAVKIGQIALLLGEAQDTLRHGGLVSHSEFEARLSARVLAARAEGATLAVGMVKSAARATAVVEALAHALGASCVVGAYGSSHYEVVAAARAGGDGVALARELGAALLAAGVEANVGIAVFPRDGTSPGALVTSARAALRPARETPEFVSEDPAMTAVSALARRIAGGRIPVLIHGETGSGKEVIADAIHRWSPRAAGPCVRLNCAAFPESLLEAELFGYEKGAFTGAAQAKPGLFEAAEGGTLFLDEIGDLPSAQQAKLLRALEDGTVRRLGGLRDRKVDVRLVTATHRDLDKAASAGEFRADLYFRLSGAVLEVPPLRARPRDILPLARRFLAAATDRPLTISASAEAALIAYPWPGNARELRNAIERAALLCDGEEISPEHLPDRVRLVRTDAASPAEGAPRTYDEVKDELRGVERARIVEALEACGGNRTRAAEMLGMPRRTLVAKLKALAIPPRR
jgi:DNA-binding NtrC family response regulator